MYLYMSFSLVTGEALLSLYPVLVKSVRVDLLTHTMTRLLTTTIICYPFLSSSMGNVVSNLSTHIVSILYLIHIYVSYVGFRSLEIGVALTLFYTYPLINVLLSGKINWVVIAYILNSLLGVALITHNGMGDTHKMLGIGAMALSAITESLIYTIYKLSEVRDPFDMLFGLGLTGSIILILIYLFKKNKQYETSTQNINSTINKSPKISIIIKLIIANMLLGIGGYLLRFYSIHQLSTEWFSVLSFVGILFGYLYGWIFYSETINSSKIIGTSLIIYSMYKVKMMGF